MKNSSATSKPLPIIAVLLGLIIAFIATYALFRDLWLMVITGSTLKWSSTGGGIGVSNLYATQISGASAWFQVLGDAGLVATGLSAVSEWLRSKFIYLFPATVAVLLVSNYLVTRG